MHEEKFIKFYYYYYYLQAKADEGKPLPSWLLFDKHSGTFWGVPSSSDVAILDMTVKGYLKTETVSTDFKLIIEEQSPFEEGRRKCSSSEDYTVLNLLVDVDLVAIKPKQKIIAMNNVANFLGLPVVSN